MPKTNGRLMNFFYRLVIVKENDEKDEHGKTQVELRELCTFTDYYAAMRCRDKLSTEFEDVRIILENFI